MMWLEMLKAEVGKRGLGIVADELAVSKTTISLVINGKYGASTQRIEEKVMRTYGANTSVACPILGEIPVVECRQHCRAAKRYGKLATGNPERLRLYLTCPTCDNRSI